MAVLIGHASIDERGKAKGGLAGDQTGKEVCTRNWYDKDWDVVLRPTSTGLANNSARLCETLCVNENIGYDQLQRNTLWNAYVRTKKISPIEKVECDCSSLMTYCAILGGANISYGTNAPTTSNMANKFVTSGSYKALTDKKYLESDEYLRRGDILVKKGSHTVMALTDGPKAYSDSKVKATIAIPNPTLKIGKKNKTEVKKLQNALNSLFSTGLLVDGSFGPKTEKAVKTAQTTLINAGLYKGEIDGSYGPKTSDSVKTYARQKGYTIK